MANDWFIQVMGDEQGPLTPAQLKKLASNGTITADTLVRRGSTADWVLAERVQGLFTVEGGEPPPPPRLPNSFQANGNSKRAAITEEGPPPVSIEEIESAVRNLCRKFVYVIDPMFERYLTPWIVRVTWILLLVGSVVLVGQAGSSYYQGLALSSVRASSFDSPSPFAPRESAPAPGYFDGVFTVVGYVAAMAIVVIAWVLALLWARVICELAIVLFNIATKLQSIDNRLETMQPPK